MRSGKKGEMRQGMVPCLASYTYNSRGNLTERTVNNVTTDYTYSGDRLTAVGNTALTYDSIGNVLTFGNKQYTWSSGRNLASITDGTNNYSYSYNKYGFRTSKTVGGTTTYFNVAEDGTIVSQSDGTDTIFFEYSEVGTPLGFVLNNTQYLYITNNSGDVMAIADSSGSIIAAYSYNEWGVPTVSAAGEQNIALANLNPIRYRGYYYDSETGYYYLQSRYYDPEICRFINADLPEYAKEQKNETAGINVFVYCCNDAVNGSDPFGMFEISRTALSIALDVMLDIIVPQFSGPMDIAGKALKVILGKSRAYTTVAKLISKLTKGVIPKFRGLFSKFFTFIRKAIWRVTGYLISNSIKGTILTVLSKIAKLLLNSKLAKAIDIILCLCSAGGWVALTIDLVDGKFNGRCRL